MNPGTTPMLATLRQQDLLREAAHQRRADSTRQARESRGGHGLIARLWGTHTL